jgi:hypothetical protein
VPLIEWMEARIAQCRRDEAKFAAPSRKPGVRQTTTQVSSVMIEAAMERRTLQMVLDEILVHGSEAADRAVGFCRHIPEKHRPHDWACSACIATAVTDTIGTRGRTRSAPLASPPTPEEK